MGADQRQKVSQPRRRLTYVRALGDELGQRVSEYRECCAVGECGCRGQHSVESGVAGGAGDGLGDGAVVGGEVIGVDA